MCGPFRIRTLFIIINFNLIHIKIIQQFYLKMVRSLFIFALLVSVTSAFVAPANRAVANHGRTTSTTAPKMMIDASIVESAATNMPNLIATSSSDFGGAFWPVAGIVSIAALILYLAPPLVGDE